MPSVAKFRAISTMRSAMPSSIGGSSATRRFWIYRLCKSDLTSPGPAAASQPRPSCIFHTVATSSSRAGSEQGLWQRDRLATSASCAFGGGTFAAHTTHLVGMASSSSGIAMAAHRCSRKCNLREKPDGRWVCTDTGLVHQCGERCAHAVVSVECTTCSLTGIVIRGPATAVSCDDRLLLGGRLTAGAGALPPLDARQSATL